MPIGKYMQIMHLAVCITYQIKHASNYIAVDVDNENTNMQAWMGNKVRYT